MNKTCIIQKIKSKLPANDDHISMITGQRTKPKATYYRNIETETKYYHIGGAIAWPGKTLPGCVIVVAVKKDSLRPSFQLLAEEEDHSINGLLDRCLDLRQRYGYELNGDLFRFWYGDHSKFASLLSDFNKEKFSSKQAEGIHIACPVDFDKPNHFEIYVRRIQTCLSPNDSGNKSLYLGACDRLRNYLQILPSDAAIKGTDEDYPAIAALGYAIHSLSACKPWTTLINDET
ncbi:hypothetical protein KA005_36910, partial [bacterium]|nr:hypothetical protein [bacterium]